MNKSKIFIMLLVLAASIMFSVGCSEDMEVREVKDNLKPYKVKTIEVPDKYYNDIWGIDEKYLYCDSFNKKFLWESVKISLKDNKKILKLPTLPGFDGKLLEIKNERIYRDLVGEKKYKDGKKFYRLYKLYTDKKDRPKKEVLYETKIEAFPQAGVICQDKIIVSITVKNGAEELI